MKTYTLDEIKDRFVVEFNDEIAAQMVDTLRNSKTKEDAAELLDAIMSAVEEPAKERGWTPLDKILWIVREAFILGSVDGFRIAADAAAMTIEQEAEQK